MKPEEKPPTDAAAAEPAAPTSRGLMRLIPAPLRRRLARDQDLARVSGSTAWILAERVVTLGGLLLVSVALARYLGPDAFGLYSYVLAVVALFAQVGTMGLAGLLVREISEEPQASGTLLGTAFALRVGGSVLAAGLALGFALAVAPGDLQIALLVAILAAGTLFQSVQVIEAHFESRMEIRRSMIARMGATGASTILTLALVLADASVATFVAVKAAESLVLAGLLVWTYRRHASVATWRLDAARAKSLLAHAWPLILSGVSASVYLKIDQVMLGAMVGDEAVGVYAAAARLSEVWYFLPTALATAAFPILLRDRRDDPARYGRRLQSLFDALFWTALAIIVPISLLAPFLVHVIYGPAYAAAAVLLALHVWAGLFIFLRAGLSKWLIAERLTTFSLVTHGAGALVNVALNLVLIPRYGGVGAAVATIVSYAVASYLSLFLHPKTWPAARMMTAALLSPVRYAARLVRPAP